MNKAYQISMEVAGDTAMWTRPDCGDCPCSYPAPSYSAVKSLFESVLWGPAITIIPRKVELCKKPVYHSYATNYSGPLRSPPSLKAGNNFQFFATVLIDVCYRLYADVVINKNKSGVSQQTLSWDKKTTSPGHAYKDIFERRLKRGQSFASLFLGWREFSVSYFGPFREQTTVCTQLPDIVIPSMLREVFSDGYRSDFNPIFDNNVCIHQGVLIYPEREKHND